MFTQSLPVVADLPFLRIGECPCCNWLYDSQSTRAVKIGRIVKPGKWCSSIPHIGGRVAWVFPRAVLGGGKRHARERSD
jgi:hypothetical protein